MLQSGAGITSDQLRAMLMQLRADQLLAASMAGTSRRRARRHRPLAGRHRTDQPGVAATGVVVRMPALASPRPSAMPGTTWSIRRSRPAGWWRPAARFPPSTRATVRPPTLPIRSRPTRSARTRSRAATAYARRSCRADWEQRRCSSRCSAYPPPRRPATSRSCRRGRRSAARRPRYIIGSIAFNTVSTTAKINTTNNEISVQVRGGKANLAMDVVGYFRTPGNYENNLASGAFATISGGIDNSATGNDSAVSGGFLNSSSGSDSVVSGGGQNVASGELSAVVGVQHCLRHVERGAWRPRQRCLQHFERGAWRPEQRCLRAIRYRCWIQCRWPIKHFAPCSTCGTPQVP